MVNGRVFGMMSGMAIAIWPGDRPFWVASWMSPARRNIPVRATRDIRKTLTSSARIIRLMDAEVHRPPVDRRASARRPNHLPARPISRRIGSTIPGRASWVTFGGRSDAEVAGHPDAEQVAADPGRQVAAVAE